MIQSLDEFKTYKKAMDIADKIYIVYKRNYYDEDTVRKQLVQ
jgi:hypothetical protein